MKKEEKQIKEENKTNIKIEIAKKLFLELQRQKNILLSEPQNNFNLDAGKIALKNALEIMQHYLIINYKFNLYEKTNTTTTK